MGAIGVRRLAMALGLGTAMVLGGSYLALGWFVEQLEDLSDGRLVHGEETEALA